jgi:hypothetical protein
MSLPIFVHIPKTAGSTLRTLITANYAPNEVLSLYGDPKEILIRAAAQIGKTKSYRLVQGHTPYGTHRFIGLQQARYLTFLRDPIDRFLSDIAHAIRHADHGFHGVVGAPGLTMKQRISNALDINYYRNNMVQYVSGSFSTEPISLIHLGTAIDNLWSSEFIGLTEQFESSLLMMAKLLGWKTIIPQRLNVRPDKEELLTPELKTNLNRALAYDRMLYEVGQEHFTQKCRAYGSLLQEAAIELAGIIKEQDIDYPNAKWDIYVVGQSTQVPLQNYNRRIKANTPLHRWLYD